MNPRSRLLSLPLLVLAPCLAGCEDDAATPDPASVSFDGERAFEDLRYLVEDIGPRRIGSTGARKTREYIQSQLADLGWEIQEQAFSCTPPEDARRKGEIQGVNVVARRPGTQPGEIWIASHYDTYDIPGFVGANDAGSSTAVLIELGRQLGGDGPRQGMSVSLVWFDGEEKFHPAAWDDHTNSTFGSRHAVKLLQDANRIKQLKALVLLDMIGDAKLGITIESRSSGWLAQIFKNTAHRGLGMKQLFVGSQEIADDHMPFIRAGVSAIDLIDFNYGPANSYWHTRDDKLEHCSAKSLETVGKLTLMALPEIEVQAAKR